MDRRWDQWSVQATCIYRPHNGNMDPAKTPAWSTYMSGQARTIKIDSNSIGIIFERGFDKSQDVKHIDSLLYMHKARESDHDSAETFNTD